MNYFGGRHRTFHFASHVIRTIKMKLRLILVRMARDTMKSWIIAALLLTVAVAQAAEPFETTFNRLVKVEHFAFGGTGFAGQISQGQKDYELILSRPSALADFERLYTVGNPQAKAYALVGIRKINPERFQQLAQPLRGSQEKVVTMGGCIVSHEVFAGVIRNIESGNYDSYRKSK